MVKFKNFEKNQTCRSYFKVLYNIVISFFDFCIENESFSSVFRIHFNLNVVLVELGFQSHFDRCVYVCYVVEYV